MNDFYINKVNDIRSGLNKSQIDQMTILRNVSPPCKETFKMPLISSVETKKLIWKQKNSASTGYDAISNKILRKIAPEIAPIIAHLINSIIRSGIFPQCLKVETFIPILKPGKPSSSIESFRPINCLPAVEKLVENWFKTNLVQYFESKNLFNDHHHGGERNFQP